jgi:hypothetical protein
MRTLRRILLIFIAAALAGCTGKPPLPPDVTVTRGFAAAGTPYGDALSRYTRKAELYEGFDTIALGWATWRTAELRRALAEASVQAYDLEGRAAEAMLREEQETPELTREFHLSLYTPKPDWNDLESANTLWRAYLEAPGEGRVEPSRIAFLPKSDKSAVEYPYVSRWTREYSLVFPAIGKGGESVHLALVLTGPLGTIRFQY